MSEDRSEALGGSTGGAGAREAAARLLDRASRRPFGEGDVPLLPAASRLRGEDRSGDMADPARALALLCGLPEVGPDRIEAAAERVPPGERLSALSALEPLLARLDPRWAWDLFGRLLGPEEVAGHGTLGLAVAARLGDESAGRALLAEKCERNPLFARQLSADAAARERRDRLPSAEDRGRLLDLLPSECRSYLAGAALVDPEYALRLADAMLQIHPPERLSPALILVARAAAAGGLPARAAARPRQEDFISVQAAWTEASAAAGTLTGGALAEHLRELAPRVADELDPGRELLAGLPLVMAAAYGAPELAPELGALWRLPPPLLADQAFQTGLRLAPVALDPLLAMSEDEWSDLYRYDFAWWQDAAAEGGGARRQACLDLLALAPEAPWRPLPGSLEDLVW